MNRKEENIERLSENLKNLHESLSGSLEDLKEAVSEGSGKPRGMSLEAGEECTCYAEVQSFAPLSPVVM